MTRRAVADTGPLRHLVEIGAHDVLRTFETVVVPEPIVAELRRQGFWDHLTGLLTGLLSVPPAASAPVLLPPVPELQRLQVPDVAALWVARGNPDHVLLSDDVALRRAAQAYGVPVMGSVGLLVRAYRESVFTRSQLYLLLDQLLDNSSLYLSRVLVADVKQAIETDPLV